MRLRNHFYSLLPREFLHKLALHPPQAGKPDLVAFGDRSPQASVCTSKDNARLRR